MRQFGLSVATNFDDGLLDVLSGYPVTEVFGKLPSDAVGGGRASFTFPVYWPSGNVTLWVAA